MSEIPAHLYGEPVTIVTDVRVRLRSGEEIELPVSVTPIQGHPVLTVDTSAARRAVWAGLEIATVKKVLPPAPEVRGLEPTEVIIDDPITRSST